VHYDIDISRVLQLERQRMKGSGKHILFNESTNSEDEYVYQIFTLLVLMQLWPAKNSNALSRGSKGDG
jgi:hypothetical protein